LLAQMQAAKPPPRLIFSYDVPAELPRPDYRLVLVFDATGDFGAPSACAGVRPRLQAADARPVQRVRRLLPQRLALSQTTAWTNATGPDDPPHRRAVPGAVPR
jgi:hypothetical protein